ncbi:MAG: hypothetical protein JNK48_00690 [Bryobacterales bacterium]|nr:hypothetical protein [Bryobacterales bacterium]
MLRQALRIVLTVLAAEIALIAAAFAWVAFYSYLIDTGHEAGYYRAYAKAASPYVSLFTGLPFFYAACRFIAPRARYAAYGVFAVYCAIEIPVLATNDISHLPGWFFPVNFASKFLGCYLGAKSNA